VEIPANVAKQHPLFGVRGWAIVLALVLSLGSVFGSILSFGRYFGSFFEALDLNERTRTLAPSGKVFVVREYMFFGPASPYTYSLVAGLALMCLANFYLVYLLLTHKKHFRSTYIAVWLLSVTFAMTWGLAASGASVFHQLIIAQLGNLAWLLYVVRSRRIHVTCENRVRSNDPILKQIPEQRPTVPTFNQQDPPPPGSAKLAPKISAQ
jgi:hypothetical protein